MTLRISPTPIHQVFLIEPKIFSDQRGFFFESFNAAEFSAQIGREVIFVQDNHSMSKKGVLRGLHYQLEKTQGKLVRVSRGAVYDVVVDLRQSSRTFGKWFGIELSANNYRQLWIPEGLAHGFLVLSDEAEFLYKTTNYWHADSEQCIAWDDSHLAIDWPMNEMLPIVSAKDQKGLSWAQAPKFS